MAQSVPFRLLIAITTKPLKDLLLLPNVQRICSFVKLPIVRKMYLKGLHIQAISELMKRKFKINANVPKQTLDLLVQRVFQTSNGVPAFAIEYMNALKDEGVVKVDAEGNLTVSAELQSQAVISYSVKKSVMDQLDKLPPAEQLGCKLACVLGNDFFVDVFCFVYYKETNDKEGGELMLEKLKKRGILFTEDSLPDMYFFKSQEFRQACYDLILFKKRIDLHTSAINIFESIVPSDEIPEAFITASLAYQYAQLVRTGQKDPEIVSKALNYSVQSAYLFIDLKDFDKLEPMSKELAFILDNCSVPEGELSESIHVRAFSAFELILSMVTKKTFSKDHHKDVFEKRLFSCFDIGQRIVSDKMRHLITAYSRLWKLLFELGHFSKAFQLSTKLCSCSFDSRSARFEAYRMRAWSAEALGNFEDLRSIQTQIVQLIEEDEKDGELAGSAKSDALSLLSVFSWARGESSEFEKYEEMLKQTLSGIQIEEEKRIARFHTTIWRFVRFSTCGKLDDWDKEVNSLLSENNVTPLSVAINAFATDPDRCMDSEWFDTPFWQDFLLCSNLDRVASSQSSDQISKFVSKILKIREIGLNGLVSICLEIVQMRVLKTILQQERVPDSDWGITMFRNVRTKVLKLLKLLGSLNKGGPLITMVAYLVIELGSLSKSYEKWKVSSKSSDADAKWAEPLRDELMICMSKLKDNDLKEKLEEASNFVLSL
jgi:hypothetical protein